MELIAMGVVWELGKLLLGSEGQHNLNHGTFLQRARNLAQVALSLLLAAGSVAASLGFFVQSDHVQQQAALSASPAYRRETKSLQDLDEAILEAMGLAARMQQADHITASRRIQDKAEKHRRDRDALSTRMSRQEGEAHLAGSDFFDQVASVLSSSRRTPAGLLRFGAHCTLAIALETIGMIFLAKFRASFLFSSQEFGDSSEKALPLPLARSRRGHSSPCHHDGTPRSRNPMIAKGRGDTGTDRTHEHGTRYRTCTEEVMSGKLKPSYRALIDRFNISHTTAGKWLHQMWQGHRRA